MDFEIHDVDPNSLYGRMEITTPHLAALLNVSDSTVSTWVKNGKIGHVREFSLGPGRKTRVFDLEEVLTDLENIRDTGKVRGGQYAFDLLDQIRRVAAEVKKRQVAASEAVARQIIESAHAAEDAEEVEIGQEAVLLDRIDHLERLVVSLAAKIKDGEPITAEESVEILDIVFRRYKVTD